MVRDHIGVYLKGELAFFFVYALGEWIKFNLSFSASDA